MRNDFLDKDSIIETIYLGGGTPSVLNKDELGQIFQTLKANYSLADKPEITLEANPDDLSREYLEDLRALGVNRLSIGIQSFRKEDLVKTNRSHSADQALQCVPDAQAAGFENISIDLIFGMPTATLEDWQKNLDQALQLDVQHLSLYALTVEEKTALAYQVQTEKVIIPTDEVYEAQFLLAHEQLIAAGFDHYELSNYGLPNRRSLHNSAYWEGVPYLGIGPAAHSYDGNQRQWNFANNNRYLKHLSEKKTPVESSESLSLTDRYHEYMMTHLRKSSGVDLERIQREWMPDWAARFSSIIEPLLEAGKMKKENDFFRLTPQGWLISDKIIADFFLD